jgi:vancomycin resistance protein YoaR
VLDAYSVNQLIVEYDAPDLIEPEGVDVISLYEQYCTPPQDAVIDPATYEITPEIYGYGFKPDDLQTLLENAYYGETVEIEFNYLVPSILSSDFTKDMFIDTLSQYQISSNIDDSKRDNNLSLSCNALNNYVVNAGATFSFNEAIGKITTTNGYSTAPVSELNGSVMGGGISQTASALYICALIADLEIIEHHNHEYAIDFCELGLDAVTDGNQKDLRIRNNTSSPIRIIAEANDGRVHIEIQGTHEVDYQIELLPQIVSKIDPMTSYQNMESNNSAGYMDGDILQKGIAGYHVKLYIEKYALDNGMLLSKEEVAQSKYAKVDEVVVRITPDVTEPPLPSEDSNATEDTEFTEPTVNTSPTDSTEASDIAA